MSDAKIGAIIVIIMVFIFAYIVQLICIKDDLKRLEYLVENLGDRQHHNEIIDDYILEKVSDLKKDIKKIKGQIFTVDEEGDK